MKARTIVLVVALVGVFAYGTYMTFQVDTTPETTNNSTLDVTTLPNATGESYANQSRVFKVQDNGYTFFAQAGSGIFGTDSSKITYRVNTTKTVPHYGQETNTFRVKLVPKYVSGNPAFRVQVLAVGPGGTATQANASITSNEEVDVVFTENRTMNETLSQFSQRMNEKTGFDATVPYDTIVNALIEYPYGHSIPDIESTNSWEASAGGRTITYQTGDSQSFPVSDSELRQGLGAIPSCTNITMSADGTTLGTMCYSQMKDLPKRITYTDAAQTGISEIQFVSADANAECSGADASSRKRCQS